MRSPEAGCPFAVETMLEYVVGELAEESANRLEEHVFDCVACANELDWLGRIAELVRQAVGEAEVGFVGSDELVRRMVERGLTAREYRLLEGRPVPCTAGPEDLVVVRIAARFAGLADLGVEGQVLDLDRAETASLPRREVVVDRDAGEIILVFPGRVVRSYPRSRWTLRVVGASPTGRIELGPFVMDHTP